MQALNDRIVSVTIQVGTAFNTYSTEVSTGQNKQPASAIGLAITASGTKFANSMQAECDVTIANLKQETRNYILTQTSPQNPNRVPKKIFINAGRVSYGTSLIYQGEILSATPSQPPDIILSMKCLTLNFQGGNLVSNTQPSPVLLSNVAQSIANNVGIPLLFEANDRTLGTYSFTGAAKDQINRLNSMGNVTAYVDNGVLVVKNFNVPLKNLPPRIISAAQGNMIGIPEVNEFGVKVRVLLDNYTTLGSKIQVISELNPAANGTYVIYKLGFEISSRDTPFYWNIEAQNINPTFAGNINV